MAAARYGLSQVELGVQACYRRLRFLRRTATVLAILEAA
jgi:hypothetical protein